VNKYKDKNNGLNKESDVLGEDPKLNKHIFRHQRKTGLATEAGNTSIKVLKTNMKQMIGERQRRSSQKGAGVRGQEYGNDTFRSSESR
jgi:hypothetical protein